MLEKWRKYSYAAQKKQRHRVFKVLFWVFCFFLVYTFMSSCFFRTVELRNDSMAPTFLARDRVLILTAAWSPLTKALPKLDGNLERGDLVLVSNEYGQTAPVRRVFSALVRFFSAQRIGAEKGGRRYALRRVMGLPGDEVLMDNYTFRVKPRDEHWSLTEFELAEDPYDTLVPATPPLWSDDFPLSSSMAPVVVGSDEFFVAADSRIGAGDSRTWGTVSASDIGGTVLFRYWPPKRFGRVH